MISQSNQSFPNWKVKIDLFLSSILALSYTLFDSRKTNGFISSHQYVIDKLRSTYYTEIKIGPLRPYPSEKERSIPNKLSNPSSQLLVWQAEETAVKASSSLSRWLALAWHPGGSWQTRFYLLILISIFPWWWTIIEPTSNQIDDVSSVACGDRMSNWTRISSSERRTRCFITASLVPVFMVMTLSRCVWCGEGKRKVSNTYGNYVGREFGPTNKGTRLPEENEMGNTSSFPPERWEGMWVSRVGSYFSVMRRYMWFTCEIWLVRSRIRDWCMME